MDDATNKELNILYEKLLNIMDKVIALQQVVESEIRAMTDLQARVAKLEKTANVAVENTQANEKEC